MSRPGLVAVAWLGVSLGVAAPLARQQEAVFRASVSGVSVSVSVKEGNVPVTGLTEDDFVLTDNGVRQTIASLSVETLPIDVTLMLDASRSVEGARLERMKAAVLDTADLIAPEDRLRLIAIQHQLNQVFPFQPGGQRPPVEALYAEGGTALFDALAAAMMRASEIDRRQLIVAYTDGQDTISVLDQDVVYGIAGNTDAVVHLVVPVRETGRNARSEVPNAGVLEALAGRTGGQMFLVDAAASITDGFRQAIDEFRRSYVLRYLPTGVEEAGWHDIEVTVPSGQYELRWRRGYGG